MTWTTPKTWGTEVLTSADMNTYLSDNTQYLYDQLSGSSSPASYSYTRTAGNYSTTSTSYVDIDASNMATTITTTGGDVLVTFAGSIYKNTTAYGLLIGLDYDGTVYTPIYTTFLSVPGYNVSFSLLFDNVSAGSHTFSMKWRNDASGPTSYLRGTSSVRAHFSVRELK